MARPRAAGPRYHVFNSQACDFNMRPPFRRKTAACPGLARRHGAARRNGAPKSQEKRGFSCAKKTKQNVKFRCMKTTLLSKSSKL